MMTDEQREIAEQIADYVRREVREVGMVFDSGGLLCILTGFSVHDGKLVWRDLMDPECDAVAQEVVERGIPDLSDDATIDALLRHLLRRGWRMIRWDNKRVEVRKVGCMLFDSVPWSAIAKAVKEEADHHQTTQPNPSSAGAG